MNATSAIPPARLAVVQEPLLPWISDQHLGLLLPVVAYWVLSLFFHALDTFELAEKYRIHTPAEVEKRNKCTVGEVVRAVLVQQVIQTLTGMLVSYFEPPYTIGHEAFEVWKIGRNLGVSESVASALYYYVFPSFRMVAAFFIMDTWEYMLHRAMHLNKWAYRNFHSVHHRLYVPYAFGALYNSLIEGFLLDTCGAGIAGMATNMTPRELIVMYTFSILKTVDDHSGYEFPFDPLQVLFPNRATYHDIHHQPFGIKTNFSQPFFIHWDVLLGSKYEHTDAYIEKNKKIRVALYNEKQRGKVSPSPSNLPRKSLKVE